MFTCFSVVATTVFFAKARRESREQRIDSKLAFSAAFRATRSWDAELQQQQRWQHPLKGSPY
jgi:hypothetical protein